MHMHPSPSLALLNAGKASRSPKGTAMLAGSTGKHIASCGPAWERPSARPANPQSESRKGLR
jgi:ABC-2 type transport system ATP-binding protein